MAVDPLSIRRLGQWPWSRRLEAELITDIALAKPKALAVHFFYLTPTTSDEDQTLHKAMRLTRTFVGIPLQASPSERPTAPLRPIQAVESAAAGVGAVDARADNDGVVRRTLLFEGGGAHPVARLMLQMAQLEDRSPNAYKPFSLGGEWLIPFVGRPGTFAMVSAAAVLEHKVPAETFRNKYVIFGSTAPELLDNYRTPMSATDGMSSAEVDANILNSLLTGSAITPLPRAGLLVLSLGLLWIILIGLVRLGPRTNLWLALVMTGLPLAASVLAVVTPGVWIAPTPYLITVAILFPYWGWRRLNAASAYFAEELRSLEDQGNDGAPIPSRPLIEFGGDVVLQQMLLLEDTKRRISNLRQFVSDILADFPDPVLVAGLDGRIQTINPAARAFARRAGLSAEMSAPIEPILATVKPFGADTGPLWPPPAARGQPGARLTGEDCDGRAYDVRFTPTRTEDNAHTGWIVHLADITPLVSAMRQREEALQLLSHDIRSPLSSIVASLNHPDFQGAPAALRRRIEGQAVRGLDLADAFVRLAKAESEDYRFEPIDLTHVLHDAADAVWSKAQAASVRVGFAPDDTEYVVLADRGLMTRAIVNLLENAVKFSLPGQTVTCDLRPAVVNGAPGVACEIADRAGGMTRAQLSVLFRRFASGRDAEGGSPGIGLGLALVNAVVMRHHGVITCDSIEGEGTVFRMTLPLLADSGLPAPTKD